MEEKASSSNRKRSFFEDDDSNRAPPQKRIRFPKGKKVKQGDQAPVKDVIEEEPEVGPIKNPHIAATERAKRRSQITAELFDEDGTGISNDILAAEETYEDSENFVEDGIQIEPFNLNKEREEGYFDAEGNYVEYVNENNEIKDAWLDSIEVDPRYAGLSAAPTSNEETTQELSSEEIGKIKRRIANALEPEETVLQALRRLKGTSGNRKEKMTSETKVLFDQLTEDAMKLMDNGEYNVYHEKREVFEREAEGYERLAQAKSGNANNGGLGSHTRNDLFPDGTNSGAASTLYSDTAMGHSNSNVAAADVSVGDADSFDMFAEDDENAAGQASHDKSGLVPGPSSDAAGQMLSDNANSDYGVGASQTDYIYDETSGYYYSSSLGYYYDPNTGLYCSAASGKWYSFNEETGYYDEVSEAAPSAN